jgi:hypothetical protein
MEIEDFKDIHKGERGFVIGNGPSLNNIDLSLLDNEITFGGNKIYLHESFSPKYYSTEDWTFIKQEFDTINSYKEPEYKFTSKTPIGRLIKGNNVVYIDFSRSGPGKNIRRTCDKENNKFYWMSTITNLLIQLAYYMGCNPIYLIGVDHFLESTNEPLKHFTNEYLKENTKYNPTDKETIELGYKINRDSLKKKGYSIINLTPNTYLDIFKKDKYENIL